MQRDDDASQISLYLFSSHSCLESSFNFVVRVFRGCSTHSHRPEAGLSRQDNSRPGDESLCFTKHTRHAAPIAMSTTTTASSKFPIDKFPVEIRIHVYGFAGEMDCKTDWERTIDLSAVLNDIPALEIASIQGDAERKIICYTLADVGNLYALKWARGHRIIPRGNTSEHADKRLRVEPLPWNEFTCYLAAIRGHYHVLKWLHEQGCPWNARTCEAAAHFGKLEVLKWLHEQGCPWDEGTFGYAAHGGHLKVLKWLHEQGCPWNERTCGFAAHGGHLEVLKWLHEQGCPWNETTCATAARYGHLEVLKWLREKQCPWNQMTCDNALEQQHREIFEWAVRNGCPYVPPADTNRIAP
jgi:hypothetical protein